MSAVAVKERVCRAPGCPNPIPIRGGSGPVPTYCCANCRKRAHRARQAAASSQVAQRRTGPASGPVAASAVPAVWNPPGERRRAHETAEPCPKCSKPLWATPRGTRRACLGGEFGGCGKPVVPRGVLDPYERGGDTSRVVQSQAERDLEAIALVQRKGVMLAQLGQLAADDRLDPASLPVVEWFRKQVDAAASGHRLDELAELLSEADIRRRHWWHGRPAALEAPSYDDQDYGDEDYPGTIEAAPAAAPGPVVDFAAELAAREWVWAPHGAGVCQLLHLKPHGWDYVPPQECFRRAEHAIPGGAVCDGCYQALTFNARWKAG